MSKIGRPGMSDEKKAELWRRWRAGESISVISRALRKPPGSVFTVLKYHGGIAPEPHTVRSGHLTPVEREAISRSIVSGDSVRSMASALGRVPSTISREINRNGGRHAYRAAAAQERAGTHAKRPKPCLLQRRPALREKVVSMLEDEWSPEQIVGHLRRHHSGDDELAISHETIYRSIYTTRWGVIPQKLCKRLRTRRPIRKNKRHTVKGQWRSQIIDARPIEGRPASAEDRSVTGHLEGDLVIGSKNSQVATLVDRKARYLTIVATPTRHTISVVPALVREYARMNPALRRSLTWDRGMELADHKLLSAATGIEMFFAAPRSPWQRGTNENTNKLLRQYLPKGMYLGDLSQADLDAIAAKLNNRPRKCLGFRTPAEFMADESVALTG
ncbi:MULTISPECIES: IS30 family transposase [Rhodococcus]|uniref:IS30 family transposase n=1 Tax=Rhodococcus qingshengii JCM 15477 TaxID=1303681 RepID=A0AB38RN35_RHOSG|nr:IS30 family transposase [Rhodococcus qingshengii]UPU46536.1 IS30 family transposase [Rhodococcus qingshengii JCM 15477]